jgi:tetratricopeptide (TPR) repeat protein
VLATLEAELQDWPHSVTHFQRAAELDPTMFNDAVDLYVSYFKRPEAAVQLADKDVEQLRLVSRKLRALGKDASAGPTTGPATRPADEQAALEADARADDLIRAAADRPNASAEILGEMGLLSAQRGDFKGAVYYLGRALIPDYGEQDWRLVYAQSLAKLGRKQEAIHQAEIILAARPQMSAAQDLIDQLTPPTTQTLDDLLR